MIKVSSIILEPKYLSNDITTHVKEKHISQNSYIGPKPVLGWYGHTWDAKTLCRPFQNEVKDSSITVRARGPTRSLFELRKLHLLLNSSTASKALEATIKNDHKTIDSWDKPQDEKGKSLPGDRKNNQNLINTRRYSGRLVREKPAKLWETVLAPIMLSWISCGGNGNHEKSCEVNRTLQFLLCDTRARCCLPVLAHWHLGPPHVKL